MRILIIRSLLLLLLVGASACSTSATKAPEVVEEGTSRAYPENAVIADRRFAASVMTSDGDTLHLADIGRLLLFAEAADGKPPSAIVYDFDSREPLDATQARYVASPSLVTPRGSGLIALGDEAQARQWAEVYRGIVLGWDELETYLRAAAAVPLLPSGAAETSGLLLPAR